MDVSVVIINYKTTDLVSACVRSVIEFTKGVSYEIIVVDNHSEDDCKKVLADISSEIIFIELDENLGFGIANNKGFQVAKGRNVLCLNPDTLLLNNAIKELSRFLDANPDAGACGGNLYDEEMNPTHSFLRFLPSVEWELSVLTFRYTEKVFYPGNHDFNRKNRPMKVGYITGADLMIRKSLLDKLKGYSPDFFMYYEDTDLCCRIKKAGYDIYSVPAARIQHLEGRSFDKKRCTVNERRIRMSEKGRLIYYKRNAGVVERTLSDWIYGVALYINIFAFKCMKNDYWKTCKLRQTAFREYKNRRK